MLVQFIWSSIHMSSTQTVFYVDVCCMISVLTKLKNLLAEEARSTLSFV